MEHYRVVLPENLNHHGFLFGGYLLKWVDEVGWIAATMDYPGATFVTVAMDHVEFRRSVRDGQILRFVAEKFKVGRTSVTYQVEVERAGGAGGAGTETIFSTHITMVKVDAAGNKTPLEE